MYGPEQIDSVSGNKQMPQLSEWVSVGGSTWAITMVQTTAFFLKVHQWRYDIKYNISKVTVLTFDSQRLLFHVVITPRLHIVH